MSSQEQQRIIEARNLMIRDLLVDHVTNEPTRQALRRRRHRKYLAIGGGLLLAATTTAGLIVLQPAPIADTSIVLCMSQTTRDSDGNLPGSSATLFHDFKPGHVNDAIELCSRMWESGALEPGLNPTHAPETTNPHPVPPLTVCVDKDGAAVVVPTSNANVCIDLRLAPPTTP